MWALCAITAALLQCATRITNQYLKIPGLKLTVTIKLLLILYVFPFLFVVPWPDSPVFYLMVALTAPLVVYQDKSLFDFTAKYGAGAVTRIEPLSVPFVFILWLILNPALLSEHLQHPLHFAGIGLCIAAAAFFAIRMRHCPVNFDVMKAMLPIVLTMGTVNIIAKTGIDYAPGFEGLVVYIFVQSVLVVLIGTLFSKSRTHTPKPENYDRKAYYFSAFAISLLVLGTLSFRLWGFMLTPNPAYVTAIMLTGPLWVLLFYRLVRHEEKSDIRPGLGIVAAAIALTFLTMR